MRTHSKLYSKGRERERELKVGINQADNDTKHLLIFSPTWPLFLSLYVFVLITELSVKKKNEKKNTYFK